MVVIMDDGNTSEQPQLATVSISSSEEDIEGGACSSSDSVSSSGDMEAIQSAEIVSKSISFGNYTRRRSQEVNMSQRRRSSSSSANQRPSFLSTSYSPKVPSTVPGSTLNQLPQIIEFQSDKKQSNRKLPPRLFHLLAIFVVAASAVASLVSQHREIRSLRRELAAVTNSRTTLQHSHASLIQDLHNANESLAAIRHAHEKINKVNSDMNDHINGLNKEVMSKTSEWENSLRQLSATEKEAERVRGRFHNMVERIQTDSRKKALEKFGQGPHQVELEVQLPSSPSTSTIKIDLASLDAMPHSVQTFLEQVDQKAWDGTYFNLHAGHVLLANPDFPKDNKAMQPNSSNEVPTVSFPEYSAQYPHDKYTVAFPGRPGSGQDFYINLRPNAHHHAPRVSKDGSFVEGEPCFGRILDASSRTVVDEMDALSFGSRGFLETPVVIKAARIL